MWGVAFILLAGGGFVLWSGLENHHRRRAWRDAAESCGLQRVEVSGWGWWGLQVSARQGPLVVHIEDSGRKAPRTVVVIGFPGLRGFHQVSIRPESLIPLPWMREIAIGDESFDSTFLIEGPMRLVCAWLDVQMRRLLVRVAAESRLEITNNALRAEMPDQNVPHILPLLLEIGRRIDQLTDIPRRLAENANQDPEARVRLQNLLLLIRELPRHPATAEALHTACSDASPEIRLRAAEALGAEAHSVLLELAESREDDALRAEAVSILGRELPFERATAILDQALRGRHIQTACACLEALGNSGNTAAVGVLAEVMAREKGELAASAALALETLGSLTAEPPLILALQHENTEVQVAAANALGRVGSVAAVLPLKEAAERTWLDLKLRRATRQAIAEIQSRLPGASPGQLSLAGAEAGQLSLAQAEAGQLSFATDAAGQLSLSGDEGEP